MRIAFFGSSLLSSYWNGAATYYRGIVRGLAERGHEVVFLEPDAFGRQQHRDLDEPPWAEVVVWQPSAERVDELVLWASGFDVVVKASGVGVLDAEL
jgi:spore maturation protein CgeB